MVRRVTDDPTPDDSGPHDSALDDRLAWLPRGRPFTAAEARERGVTPGQLHRAVRSGHLAHPVRGVYHRAGLADGLPLRVAVLRLVVPEACVVTDRTAAWLLGARMALAPNDHVMAPLVNVFCPPGHRLRNGLSSSGERRLEPDDVLELNGLRVTSALRTACDLGRLLHRDPALGALDALAALGHFDLEELALRSTRYPGYRGVIQLRNLVPLVDPRAQSPGESSLRLRWLDHGLPRPECQVAVPAPGGGLYYVDIGLPDLRFGAEYDGAEFHGPAEAEHDTGRRCWLERRQGWSLVVARNENVYGRTQDVGPRLASGYRACLKARETR